MANENKVMFPRFPPTNPAANRLPRRAVPGESKGAISAEPWRLQRTELMPLKSECGRRAAGALGGSARWLRRVGVTLV